MANSSRSAPRRGGAVAPPNRPDAAGNRAQNGYLPLVGTRGPVVPHAPDGHRPEGSTPRMKMPSPVHPPDHRFDVGKAKMPQPPSAIEPGKGAIPVTPWDSDGQPNQAGPVQDIPRSPKR
jgi:hypothetical protein